MKEDLLRWKVLVLDWQAGRIAWLANEIKAKSAGNPHFLGATGPVSYVADLSFLYSVYIICFANVQKPQALYMAHNGQGCA